MLQNVALSLVLLVANSKDGTVSVVDAETFESRCEIDVVPDRAERAAEWGLIHRIVNWYGEWRFADVAPG